MVLRPVSNSYNQPAGVDPEGSESHMSDMKERLAKLEGAFDGVKTSIEGVRHAQNITIGTLSIGFGLVIAFMFYLLNRIDNLPAEFERLNTTLSNAITATKQAPTQVIMVPTPLPPPLPPGKPQ